MENKITKDLSEDELISIRDEVSKYMIEGDLVSLSFSVCVCSLEIQMLDVSVLFWVVLTNVNDGFCRGGSMH